MILALSLYLLAVSRNGGRLVVAPRYFRLRTKLSLLSAPM